MKFNRNYKIVLLVLLLAFASCGFTSKSFENTEKDKLLVELITLVLEESHLEPADLNDTFSEHVYYSYLDIIDPFKRYFDKSDIKKFREYLHDIDDQIKSHDLSFFNLTHQRLLKRIEESKSIYKSILENPFNYAKEESYNADYEKLPYAKNKKALIERWRKQLKFVCLGNFHDLKSEQNKTLELEKKPDDFIVKTDTELETESREMLLNNLNERYDLIDDRRRIDWFSDYLNAIVLEFDPHTVYFAPIDKDRFDAAMTGKYEGIGARLQKKMDDIIITELISGGSAWRQNKLEVGDKILKVRQEEEDNAVNVVGMRLDDAVKLIKGPKGTNVILTLKKIDGTIEDLTVPRDVIELEETYAKSAIVNKDDKVFGVINLPRFYFNFEDYKSRNASSDIKKEIERLKMQDMEGLILDLRNNGGGSLKTVVDMVGLFIEEGPVVQIKSSGKRKKILRDKDRSITWNGPLVVLVNELSASASEILAAAMQDYKRAIVIGSKQTYGKGTVQNIFDLNRYVRNNTSGDLGALKFTTDKFYRINGGSTQLEGVKSDVVVPDRYSYINLGERDLNNPMTWDKIEPVHYEYWQDTYNYDLIIDKSTERMRNSKHFKLIDENAKWIKTIRDRKEYSLNYKSYSYDVKLNEEESKRFDSLSDYTTNLSFKSLPYEELLTEQDSVLKVKRQRWHENLSKDVYIEEALNVLNDLKNSHKKENKLAEVKE